MEDLENASNMNIMFNLRLFQTTNTLGNHLTIIIYIVILGYISEALVKGYLQNI